MRRFTLVRASCISALLVGTLVACEKDPVAVAPVPIEEASVPDASTVDPFAGLETDSIPGNPALKAPVRVFRDDAGIPHIYAQELPDAAYAQGYMMAKDRFIEMDFGRRQASGTLSKAFGDFSAATLTSDIRYRSHHLRATGEVGWKKMLASTDPVDQKVVTILKSFTAGVNAWRSQLLAGKEKLPEGMGDYYGLSSVEEWSELDSIVLGELQAFQLAFDGSTDITRSAWEQAETSKFVGQADAAKAARVGTTDDYWRFLPFDPTFTVDGWKEVTGAGLSSVKAPVKKNGKTSAATIKAALAALDGVGLDKRREPDRGSNNWVIAPKLSASGHAMVANDTHLSLSSPAIFYLSHLHTEKDGVDLMGAQFPGIPLVTLGMNKRMAWGSTVNYIDVTDAYRETVVDCANGGGKCVVFKGQQVKLVERKEEFETSSFGRKGTVTTVTYYDVPHHGPIVPRITGSNTVEALKGEEISIRYTGYESAPLLRAIYNLDIAENVDQAVKALEADFAYGGQNWVLADDAGNIAWTQTIRVPRRPKGTKAWKILPGDGTAEWDGYFDPKYVPHAKNPEKGYLVTANADPLGLTADNDPSNEPEVGGFPLYMGSDYDPGARAGRITTRIKEGTADKKLDRDALSSIQADAVTQWGKTFQPAFLAATKALSEEIATPGSHPELTTLVGGMSAAAKAALAPSTTFVTSWSFDTPAGTEADASAKVIADSQATLVMAAFATKLAQATLSDEASELGVSISRAPALKLLATLLTNPSTLKTKEALFDDLRTPAVETRAITTAKAAIDPLTWTTTTLGEDTSAWRWGKVHTLTPQFYLPIPTLAQKTTPRHGGDGTVDVASHGIEDDDYTYGSGASIRFVCELDPARGPVARNVIPGGEVFDPKSPHFSDLYDLYVKNQTTELAFSTADVVTRAKQELEKNKIKGLVFNP